MRRVLNILSLGAALAYAGCRSGEIVEGLPRLREPLPEDTRVCLARPYKGAGRPVQARSAKLVTEAFLHAFRARGISVTLPEKRSEKLEDFLDLARASKCDVALFTEVEDWTYNDAGFSGFGERDEVTLAVTIADLRLRRVISRTRVIVRNGFGVSATGGNDTAEGAVAPVVDEYVRSLFPPR